MELKELIKTSIIQIADGLSAGSEHIKSANKGTGNSSGRFITVDFDVAVTSGEEDKTGLGGKITIANLVNFGGNNEVSIKNTSFSRIQFSVPLNFH